MALLIARGPAFGHRTLLNLSGFVHPPLVDTEHLFQSIRDITVNLEFFKALPIFFLFVAQRRIKFLFNLEAIAKCAELHLQDLNSLLQRLKLALQSFKPNIAGVGHCLIVFCKADRIFASPPPPNLES